MTLYRAICHNLENIKIDKLGIHWSLREKSAYPFGCKHRLLFYYLYVAECNEQDVNTKETDIKNKEWPWEQEVVLFPGAQVTIIQIKKIKKPCQTLIETFDVNYITTT